MSNILDEIIAAKTKELVLQKDQVGHAELETRIAAQAPPLNLSGALMGGGVRLIAEVKKASPSRGLLRPEFDPVDLAQTYVDNGAAAVSETLPPSSSSDSDSCAGESPPPYSMSTSL